MTNPVTNLTTTVTALIKDPAGTATAGTAAFVRTIDGYVFLVKDAGEYIYNSDSPPEAYLVVSKTAASGSTPASAEIRSSDNKVTPFAYQTLYTTFQAQFYGEDGDGVITPPATITGASGVSRVQTGQGGSNGRAGALFVSPRSGGDGQTGPWVSYSNQINISATNQVGIEVGSVGGKGGNGGSSYLSFHSGRSGGDGGEGGSATVVNQAGISVQTSGIDAHGIYTYSKSGRAGDGGSGYLAPGGGSSGHSNDGGSVAVTNNGSVLTSGLAANGIYALSVSNNGGNGGSSWGLVGGGGNGSYGGNGGQVTVVNSVTGEIFTSGIRAHGILAQSIGGSGGSSGSSGNLIFSYSGSTDDGGSGGKVNVSNYGKIATIGDHSRGIFAQSIGGGGGSGGGSWGLVALGGSGSFGGDGDAVTVKNFGTGSILTSGERSDGIFAQSVGGSGGSGSNSGGLVSVGGSGSYGGNGGAIVVENFGLIETAELGARGIVAQSIGGGGGDGGNSGGMVSVGGEGSGGGTGALVSVRNGGTIRTNGDEASGIIAQSIGGGGGNGGSSGSVGVFVGVAIGGSGGTGGTGGDVLVNLEGAGDSSASLIRTEGDRSTAVFAQSVGGGGGNGGGAVSVSAGFGAAASISLGGTAGAGGDGGRVTLGKGLGYSIIETSGDDSSGLFLQSVGGGGGNGGYAIALAASGGPVSGSLAVAIGADGGSGGEGGKVQVGDFASNGSLLGTGFEGSILTRGDRSTGFFAQSVGGGGGNGGLAVAGTLSVSPSLSGSISIGLGGSGAGGGAGGLVQVGTQGNITTQGDHATGMLVQSVGGGGGNGGGSIAASLAFGGAAAGTIGVALGGDAADGGLGGEVRVTTRGGTTTTSGMNSTGLLIQSVGGGGGNGGYSIAAGVAGAGKGAGAVNVSLGGSGGKGGEGGNVFADLETDVITSSVLIPSALDPQTGAFIPQHYAANSTGILVQSVGGGGGNGGFSIAAGMAAAGQGSGAVSVGLGGSGATGGIGGSVNVTYRGDITTRGDRSGGFIAQSIGGGGGNGGGSIAASLALSGTGSGTVGVALGGDAAEGGVGGEVRVTTRGGTTTTSGTNSTGLLIQSVGGGGGNGGYAIAAGVAGAGTGAAAVNVSLGGSGGKGGKGGDVFADLQTDVITSSVLIPAALDPQTEALIPQHYATDSTGILVQSVGGGGGNGGFSIAAGVAGGGQASGAVSVGLGGSGAAGGIGGSVDATYRGNISTRGDRSGGLIAQSIGGGGGNGGYNVSVAGAASGSGSGAISVGLGGSGGAGNHGGAVTLRITEGTIATAGNDSIGVLAQSVGGGGGNGGFTVSSAISIGETAGGAVSVGLGGTGNGGGNGGIVNATTSGVVWTKGDRSSGIVAQSVGGGGGNGGFSVTVPVGAGGTVAGAVGVGIGGRGDVGGNGGKVFLTANNQVLTEGSEAIGILAQSVGGGGGNGGFSITAALAGAGTGSAAVGVGIGGGGGGAGDAGSVVTRVVGNVETRDSGSGGVLSHSVGGGGGSGGIAITGTLAYGGTGSGAVSVGLGGSGGGGGEGGTVDSIFTGDVLTAGHDSFGVAAQSIGGGGGNGGLNVSGAIGLAGTGSGAVAIGIGGSGGSGSNSARVDNKLEGFVQTKGDRSAGLLSQSLGGGGGNGGINVSGSIAAAGKGTGAVAVGLGGSGGAGGNGGIVVSELIGGVTTMGHYSDAVLSQSIGGGGGSGGMNVSGALSLTKQNGGAVAFGMGGMGSDGGQADDVFSTVRATTGHPQITTIGNYSSGVVAQSLGGGGGNGGMNISGAASISGENGAAIGIGLGGFGGGGGKAGKVTVNAAGQIVTMGNYSHGMLAQSIGGGGGNGGMNISGTLALTNSSGGSNTTAAVSIGIGGFGGDGGHAGAVDLSFEGSILTQPGVYVPESIDPISDDPIPATFTPGDGEGSHGIAAQSIGGGGGNGGINVSGGISYARGGGDGYGLVFGFGGFGGGGGNADEVKVNVTGEGSITAYGAGHSAILAQSVGGGGGSGGMNVSGGITSDSPLIVGVGGYGGDAGIGAAVTVRSRADIYASSMYSRQLTSAGILAQSIGGGGGNGGLNVSGGLTLNKAANVPSVTLGIGGGGGAGAISGNVLVDHLGNVVTSGDWIHGIMAQSIGGGGGNGGMNVTGQINLSDSQNSGGKTDLSIVAGVGGNGGTGANAGDVKVVHDGSITTQGQHARGVVAQSIGGGGGTGGMNVTGLFAQKSSPIIIGVGGTGGSGGNAGAVTILRGSSTQSTGLIQTQGAGAHAIEASSIGGGGGDAGMNFNLAFTKIGANESAPGFAAVFAIGGGGGDAGEAGSATVRNFSDLTTLREGSHGILAQSLGGGGGNATFNIAIAYAGGSNDPFNDREGKLVYQEPNKNMGFSFALGGATGDGGAGSDVIVEHVGTLQTVAKNSIGILAQSIGGGGGNAGFDLAFVKADGGKAGVSIGRVGGTGGEGGTVSLSAKGLISTLGDRSHGLMAQSVGNGGGNSSTTTISAEAPSNESPTGETRPISGSLSIGLEGGQGGRGGNVSLIAEGSVSTSGKFAHAIIAQSIGGGGGNGGDAKTFGITAAAIGLALGAEGGEGGSGGSVDVSNMAQLRTYAEGSIGILAQSVGGGGGTGGMAMGGGLKSGGTGISLAIGGKGGKGMTGGAVSVSNSGVIITDGVGSHGILAQSLGGGGGIGASAINMIVKNSVESATRVAMTVGGDGGEGALGGNVEVINTGGIGTTQAQSVGILAQSIGGGGGNANEVLTNGVLGTSGNHISATLGGSGGEGAAGGTVTVRSLTTMDPNSGKIVTLGNESHGIMAMSIGGGGGNGSTTVTTVRSGASVGSTAGSYSLNLGGSGGTGGQGNVVEVENGGLIQTYGHRAHGILAQSIGGGGGNGGMSLVGDLALGSKTAPANGKVGQISIGGFGGDGNTSGLVRVINRGTIEVFGAKSYGIFAQSVGGGGGDGAFAMAMSRNLLKNPGTDLLGSLSSFALGGFGGTGADSGDVIVDHTGSIISHGDDSYGIFAQSVAGGGGNAASSLSAPAWTAANFALNQIIGGGSAGVAGVVTIRSTGTIAMYGANSIAQMGQSVNGGGGNVELFLDVSEQAAAYGDVGEIMPNPGGDYDKVKAFIKSGIKLGGDIAQSAIGGFVEATHFGDLYVDGKNSVASLFQSVGGGGGRASQEIVVDSGAEVDLELILGGSGSSDSHGGDITLNRDGDVFAGGELSRAVSVQSIGGGGGDLVLDLRRVAGVPPTGTTPTPSAPEGDGITHFSFGPMAAPPVIPSLIQVGGDGGGRNDGGNLNLNFTGNVANIGDFAPAMIYQSIGGGGGQFLTTGLVSLQVDLGGINGAIGDGGDIEVINSGGVYASGIRANGVVLQSIGGGGGAVMTDMDQSQVSVILSAANEGNGGDLRFIQKGEVQARGARSTGIVLQSLGGGGGLVDDHFRGSAGGLGSSGAIQLTLDGNLFADGKGGLGIFAQSRGSLGQGNIDLDLTGHHSLVFGEEGTGVYFSGGAENRLVSDHTIVGLEGIKGWAIRGEEGGEFIDNRGTVVGQVDLGGGRNGIVNQQNAVWISGKNLLLGQSENLFLNRGEIHPGGFGLAFRTRMTGSFAQERGATTFAELNFRSRVLDGIDLTGTASLKGKVAVSLLNPQLVPSGRHEAILFSAAEGTTDRQLRLVTAPSVVISYRMKYPNRTDAVLAYKVDFSPKGRLGINLREVGDYFNRIQGAGSSSALAETVKRLLYSPDMAEYRFLLSQLGPDFYGELQAEMIRSQERFGESLLGQSGHRFEEDGRVLWFDYNSADTDHSSYDDYKAAVHRSNSVAMGFELEWDNWTTGAAISRSEQSSWGYGGQWQGEGHSESVGWVLKYASKGTEVAGVVSYGWNTMDVTRSGQVTDPFLAAAERDLAALTAMLRVSHEFSSDALYLKPAFDLGVTRLDASGAEELGGGPTGLILGSNDESHAWVRPGVELGKEFALTGTARLRLHAEAGYLHYFEGGLTTAVAGFQGAPAGIAPMEVPVEIGSMTSYGIGSTLMLGDEARISVIYTRGQAQHFDFDALNVRFSTSF